MTMNTKKNEYQITRAVSRVKEHIEEYADCRCEMDSTKTAVEIVNEVLNAIRPTCPICGADKQNYREMMGRGCWEEHGEGS